MSASLKASADGTQAIIQVNGVDKVVVDSGGIASGYKDGSIPDAALAVGGLGVGQTWQNMTGLGGRAVGATITNSSGKPIMVSISVNISAGSGTVSWEVGGVTTVLDDCNSSSDTKTHLSTLVPNGATYKFVNAAGNATITTWAELR